MALRVTFFLRSFKMGSLSGRLREVANYKSRNTGGFFQEEVRVGTHIRIQFLSCNMCNQCFREKSNFTAVAECR